MPDFAYTARDLTGKKLSGTIHAGSKADAASQLGAKSLFPIEVKAAKSGGIKFFGRVSGQVMANQYVQLAQLLRSGVPLLRSLALLAQQTPNQTLKDALLDVKSRVEEGDSLGDAMARYPRVFNEMCVNMVRAGSEGGFLEDSLERVGYFIEQQEELKGKTFGALAYPGFIFAVGSVIITVLLVFFVPKFEPLFGRMRDRGGLPVYTELLLSMSAFMQQYWWVIFIAIVGSYLGMRYYLQTEDGKVRGDYLKIKVPLLGGVFLNLAVARFCRVLGTLLVNGVPILRALEISRDAAGNRILSRAIEDASENITAGEHLAKPLGESKHFPPAVVEMIAVAEESNTLDTVLVQISNNLEKTTFRRLEVVVRLLEPMMLLVLAVIVMFIVLALMIPVVQSSTAA
jgi:general secretion pathway protein F/type IV pilus assembly protein PilC